MDTTALTSTTMSSQVNVGRKKIASIVVLVTAISLCCFAPEDLTYPTAPGITVGIHYSNMQLVSSCQLVWISNGLVRGRVMGNFKYQHLLSFENQTRHSDRIPFHSGLVLKMLLKNPVQNCISIAVILYRRKLNTYKISKKPGHCEH